MVGDVSTLKRACSLLYIELLFITHCCAFYVTQSTQSGPLAGLHNYIWGLGSLCMTRNLYFVLWLNPVGPPLVFVLIISFEKVAFNTDV